MTLKYRKLSSEGEALMPGAASTHNRQIGPSTRVAKLTSLQYTRTRLCQQPLRLLQSQEAGVRGSTHNFQP
jgi:hypothetical protein